MPFAPKAPIDLALKERIRIAYQVEERPMTEVADLAGVGKATLYRWFRAWEWPLRRALRSRRRIRGAGPAYALSRRREMPFPDGEDRRTAPREPLKLRLQRLVEHRISVLEHEAMAGIAVDADANARAIELNARTLVAIERLGGETGPSPNSSDERPKRSLTELRDELYGHLHRIREERRARARSGEDAGRE